MAKVTSKRKRTRKKASSTSTATSLLNALEGDPAAMGRLADDVASALFSGGFAANIIDAVVAVVAQSQASGAGRLLAGTVSTRTGALQLNGSSVPTVAMVFLSGASTAVPVYIPTHIRSQIATGQEVWVLPINGLMNDLMILSIRALF